MRPSRDRLPVLNSKSRKSMFAVLLRNPDAFESVMDVLNENRFAEDDRIYAVLWRIAKGFYDKMGKLPSKRIFRDELSQLTDAYQADLIEDEIEDAERFLDFAFDKETFSGEIKTIEHAEWAMGLVKRYLNERAAEKVSEAAALGKTAPMDLPRLLQEAEIEAEAVSTLGQASTDVPFPEDAGEPTVQILRKTGCDYWNDFLGGGDAPGLVYGVSGPYGSWKTLNACQMSNAAVRQANRYVRQEDWNGVWPLTALISYEASLYGPGGRLGELQVRLLAEMAQVPKETLETDLHNLSKKGELKEYEEIRYKRQLDSPYADIRNSVAGETERIARAKRILNRHLVVFDFSGGDPKRPNAGYGGVNEIAGVLAAELRSRDRRDNRKHVYNLVYVDHLALMASNYLEQNSKTKDSDKEMQTYLKMTPRHLSRKIATKFNTPVWINNQFSGEANSRRPTARLHHTDGAGSKQWGMYLDFHFAIHAPTPERLCVVACTKYRHRPPMPNVIVRVEGEFSRVVPTKGEYRVLGGRIVESKGAETITVEHASAASPGVRRTRRVRNV